MRAAALLLALAACSPFQRVALKRCPTMITAFGDFAAGSALLGMSALAYNAGRVTRSVNFAALGMALFIATGVSECKR